MSDSDDIDRLTREIEAMEADAVRTDHLVACLNTEVLVLEEQVFDGDRNIDRLTRENEALEAGNAALKADAAYHKGITAAMDRTFAEAVAKIASLRNTNFRLRDSIVDLMDEKASFLSAYIHRTPPHPDCVGREFRAVMPDGSCEWFGTRPEAEVAILAAVGKGGGS